MSTVNRLTGAALKSRVVANVRSELAREAAIRHGSDPSFLGIPEADETVK